MWTVIGSFLTEFKCDRIYCRGLEVVRNPIRIGGHVLEAFPKGL